MEILRELAIDYGGHVDGPCPVCGEDNETDDPIGFALKGRPRLCEECVELVPAGLADTITALNDLDRALLHVDRGVRRAALRAVSEGVEWLASEYGGVGVTNSGGA